MHLVKDTPLELGYFVWQVRPPRPSLTVVLKATYAIAEGTLKLARRQRPVSGELFHDDDEAQSIRTDSDLAVLKPAGECFLSGHCHAPGGKPATTVACGFSVGAVKRTFVVHGDRYWNKGIFANSHSKPEPFTKMPLRWERSFGGPDVPENPHGRGIRSEGTPAGPRVYLANIEAPTQRVDSPSARPAPHGAFPMGRGWPARMRHVGTYDGAYRATRWPYFPEDFSWEYFNAAPVEQRIEGFFRGDEEIALQHLHPTHTSVRARLPGLKPRAFLLVQRGAQVVFEEVRLSLDTVSIDADAWEVHAVCRGLAEVDDEKLEKVGFLFATHDEPGVTRSLDEVRAAFDRARRAANISDAVFAPEDLALEDDGVEVTLEDAEDEEELSPEAHAAAVARAQERAAVDREEAKLDAQLAQMGQGVSLESIAAAQPAKLEADELEAMAREAGVSLPADLLAWLRQGPEDAMGPAAAGEGEAPETRELRVEIVARIERGESLAGEDLTGADLSGLDLSDVDLTGAILVGASLARAALVGAKLDGALLSRASLASANLTGASLTKADLVECDCTGASLTRADLSGAIAAGAKFNRTTLDDAKVLGADLVGASFVGAHAVKLDATGADLSRAQIERADFSDALFVDASLEGAVGARVQFARADMTRVRAAEVHLPYGQLQRVRASQSVWSNARLERANFSFSELAGADFGGASLLKATMNGCDLRRARFDEAQVQMASLIESDALAANFTGADLSLSDARGSSFFSAEFFRATTTETKFDLSNLKRTKLEER